MMDFDYNETGFMVLPSHVFSVVSLLLEQLGINHKENECNPQHFTKKDISKQAA